MSGTAGISCTTRSVCCVRAQPTIKGPSSQRRLRSWRRQPSARGHATAALPEILPALETSSWVPQEAVQLVADLASNLGVLDPGPGDSDLAADWDVAKGASTCAFSPCFTPFILTHGAKKTHQKLMPVWRWIGRFEPGVRVDPAAVFACVLLGVFGLDASLQSMNVPFIGVRSPYQLQ